MDENKKKMKFDEIEFDEILETCNKIIIIKNIPSNSCQEFIGKHFDKLNAVYEELEIIADKKNGTTFCYVTFLSQEHARQFINSNFPSIYLGDRICLINYKRIKENCNNNEWDCDICGTFNFRKRDFCFKCQKPRPEKEKMLVNDINDGSDDISDYPTSIIIIRGLLTLRIF
jgi:RNA-binding protein 5/10